MRKSNVRLSLNGEEFSLEDAAILLDYDPKRLYHLVNRAPEGFKLREKDDIVIKRASALQHRRGITIVRESDHKKWDTAKSLAKELNIDPNKITIAMRANQYFMYNNEKYDAINYVKRNVTLTKPRAKGIEIERLTQKPILNKVPTQHIEKQIKDAVKELSTEDRVFDLLKKLAIERIQNTDYVKASKVLNALEMLKN